jgi:hypothetical protein
MVVSSIQPCCHGFTAEHTLLRYPAVLLCVLLRGVSIWPLAQGSEDEKQRKLRKCGGHGMTIVEQSEAL